MKKVFEHLARSLIGSSTFSTGDIAPAKAFRNLTALIGAFVLLTISQAVLSRHILEDHPTLYATGQTIILGLMIVLAACSCLLLLILVARFYAIFVRNLHDTKDHIREARESFLHEQEDYRKVKQTLQQLKDTIPSQKHPSSPLA